MHQSITTPSPRCFDTHVIPNDNVASQALEASDEASLQPSDPVQAAETQKAPPFMLQQQEHPSQVPLQQIRASPMTQVNFTSLQQVQPNLIEEEDEPTTLSPSDELLRWH